MKKKVSLISPVYNNAPTLPILVQRIESEVIAQRPDLEFEIIFVNDGSKDDSLDVLKELAKQNHRIIVVNLSRNFGQIYAILAGWRTATGDVSVDFSADLQDPPAQCLNMLSEWEKGYKVVVSYRQENHTTFLRKITSKLFYNLIMPEAPHGGFDFTLLDRQALDIITSFKDKNKFYQADILSLGLPFSAIPYIKEARPIGKSQYSTLKRVRFFLNMYMNISYAPIKWVSALGFITTLVGFVYAIIVLLAYFLHQTPFSGYTPLMLVILIIGGLIMLSLGIIGQYIWRILDEVRGRPNYIIQGIIRHEDFEK